MQNEFPDYRGIFPILTAETQPSTKQLVAVVGRRSTTLQFNPDFQRSDHCCCGTPLPCPYLVAQRGADSATGPGCQRRLALVALAAPAGREPARLAKNRTLLSKVLAEKVPWPLAKPLRTHTADKAAASPHSKRHGRSFLPAVDLCGDVTEHTCKDTLLFPGASLPAPQSTSWDAMSHCCK